MIKSKEIGRIPGGDVVCLSRELFEELLTTFGMEAGEFLQTLGGVQFSLPGVTTNVGIDFLTSVDLEGKTHQVVLIGSIPEKFVRFLENDEPTFREFWENKKGTAEDYRRLLTQRTLKGVTTTTEGEKT